MRNNRFWPGVVVLIVVAGLLYWWVLSDPDMMATIMSPFGGGHLRR